MPISGIVKANAPAQIDPNFNGWHFFELAKEVPAPLPVAAHLADSLAADITGEQWGKPVPPHPHRLVAYVDPALEQSVRRCAAPRGITHTSLPQAGTTSGEVLKKRIGLADMRGPGMHPR